MAYDSTGKEKPLVFLPRGEVRLFRKCDRGLFYSNMAVGKGMVLLNTEYCNKYNYSEQNYTRALLVRKLQYKIDFPSHIHLVKILENKVQMLNFPLNWDDVRGDEDVWGGKSWMPKTKDPKTKNPHIRGTIYPSQLPSYIDTRKYC